MALLSVEFTVRQMVPSDQKKVKEITALSFSRFMGFFAVRSIGDEGQVLVAESKGIVIGFAKLIDFVIGGEKYGCILWVGITQIFVGATSQAN